MTWPASIQEIIDEFQDIDEQFERLEVLMDFSDEVEVLPVEEWTEHNLVKGCQSIAHIVVEIADGTVWMKAAADAKIVQLNLKICFVVFQKRTSWYEQNSMLIFLDQTLSEIMIC